MGKEIETTKITKKNLKAQTDIDEIILIIGVMLGNPILLGIVVAYVYVEDCV